MRVEKMFEGATFKDFLLRPRKSVVESRYDPHREKCEMRLTRQLKTRVPIIAANMDTVTEENMAAAMAFEGGIGILHRNCSIEKQVTWLTQAKRRHSFIIEDPITIYQMASIAEAQKVMREHSVSGLLVVYSQEDLRLAGVLSHRDIPDDPNSNLRVLNLMTPRHKVIYGTEGIHMRDAEQMMFAARVEKLPILSKDRDRITGLITKKDLRLVKERPYSSRDEKGRLLVGAAVGVSGNFMERAEALVNAGLDCLVVDIAHAHSTILEKAFKKLRQQFKDFPIIVGNIATGEAAKFLVELGADAVKVGIGPGKGCRTRLETGFGGAQLRAVREVYLAVGDVVPIIADGGMSEHSHLVLALMAGASQVMLGSVLAGTDESPGMIISDPQTKQPMKRYRGMTSPEATRDHEENAPRFQAQEGQSSLVLYRGSVVTVIGEIYEHLMSAISYSGAGNLYDAHCYFSSHVKECFERLTQATQEESYKR